MVDRYAKIGNELFKIVPGTDFIWMATYLGEIDYFLHSSTLERTKYFFAKGKGRLSDDYNIIFELNAFKKKGSDEYMCNVQVNGDTYSTFEEVNGNFRDSASAWFYDNEWPVYLDGEPAPDYDWMYDVVGERIG